MIKTLILAIVVAGGIAWATPASADFCLQMSGELSGDLGFFRFKAYLPKKSGNMLELTGRVAGLGPVYGTAVRADDSSFIALAATFFADGEQGQFDVILDGPNFTSGSGGAEYGSHGVDSSVTVAVVSCDLEPSGAP